QSAWVEAQVEDQTFDSLLIQLAHDFFQVLVRPAGKLIEANVVSLFLRIDGEIPSIVVVPLEADHAYQFDVGASDLILQGLVLALAIDLELDFGARLAFDFLDR